jgi:hypothetical protein
MLSATLGVAEKEGSQKDPVKTINKKEEVVY